MRTERTQFQVPKPSQGESSRAAEQKDSSTKMGENTQFDAGIKARQQTQKAKAEAVQQTRNSDRWLPTSHQSSPHLTENQAGGLLGTLQKLGNAPLSSAACVLGTAALVPSMLFAAPPAANAHHLNRNNNDFELVDQPVIELSTEDYATKRFDERLFMKMDVNKDGQVNRDEVKDYLKSAGVESGLFGLVRSQASKAIMDSLDADKNGIVTASEASNIVKSINGAEEFLAPSKVSSLFAEFDRNDDGKISPYEMKKGIRGRMSEDMSYRLTISRNAAKVMTDLLDTNQDKNITKAELTRAANEAVSLRVADNVS